MRRPAVGRQTGFPDEKRQELQYAAAPSLEALTGTLLRGGGFLRGKAQVGQEKPEWELLLRENPRAGAAFR